MFAKVSITATSKCASIRVFRFLNLITRLNSGEIHLNIKRFKKEKSIEITDVYLYILPD